MRSRYLADDHFPLLRSSSSDASRCFPFPQIPATSPPIPSPLLPSAFDLFPDLDAPLRIDPLPIDAALALFLADVVPREVPVEIPEGSGGFDYREAAEGSGVLEFEVPETDFPVREDASDLEGHGMRISVEEIPMDKITTEICNDIPYPHDIEETLCSPEDIPLGADVSSSRSNSREFAGLLNGTSAKFDKVLLFEVGEVVDIGAENLTKELFDQILTNTKSCDEIQFDEMQISFQEPVTVMNFDDSEDLGCTVPKEYTDSKLFCLSSLVEIDLLNMNDNVFVEKCSSLYPLLSDGDTFTSPCFIQLQEIQMFDLSHSMVEIFGSLQSESFQVPPYEIVRDDISSDSAFFETIISSELALVDETFMSLPVPFLMHDKEKISLTFVTDFILNCMTPHPLSACDGIYLDWHLTLDNTCGHENCYNLMEALLDVSTYQIDNAVEYHGKTSIVIDLDFWDDKSVESTMLQGEETTSIDFDATFLQNDVSPQILETENLGSKNPSDSSGEKVSACFQSMLLSNDLNYFINVRRGTSLHNSQELSKEQASHGQTASSHNGSSMATSSKVNTKKMWDIETHHISLPDHYISLVDAICEDYFGVLTNYAAKTGGVLLCPEDDGYNISKEKLSELIRKKPISNSYFTPQDDDFVPLVILYGLRQLSYLLCAFGIQSAYLYLINLCQINDFLKVKLKNVASLLEDALVDAKKKALNSHPSLSVMEKILRSNGCQNGEKLLIIAKEGFWLPLKEKLSFMKILFKEASLGKSTLYHRNPMDENSCSKSILEALYCSDCLLLTYEHISASFPFHKFTTIIEYGDIRDSSFVSHLFMSDANLPRFFFLHIKLDHGAAKALSEGFDMPPNPEKSLENAMGFPKSSTNGKGSFSCQTIFQILNFVPVEDGIDRIASSESDKHAQRKLESESTLRLPTFPDTKITNCSTSSFPDTIIVVNTQTSEKEMIMSRRSSYQKILALEKEGVQVAERDIDLPVDLIFSAANCLIWYDAKSLTKHRDTPDGYGYISMFTENVATNVLMALSFAFQSCTLVFEGDGNFLAAVMDCSDTIIATAATLDMHVQILCSYSSETTDEIILNCIKRARNLFGGLFPPMPESETLAESFLTKFPSINPLSAHAILSSGGMLVDFLEWTCDHRVLTTRKFKIPDESLVLFSILCKFGEHGESKSVMTECSSIDSEINSSRKRFENKRQKLEGKHIIIDLEADDLVNIQQRKPPDEIMKPVKIYGHSDSKGHCDLQGTVEGVKSYNFQPTTKFSGLKSSYNFFPESFDLNFQLNQKNSRKRFMKEVVDFDSIQLQENFPDIFETTSFSSEQEIGEKENGAARRPGSYHASQSFYPLSADIEKYHGARSSQKECQNILKDDCSEFSQPGTRWYPSDLNQNLSFPVRETEKKNPGFSHQRKIPDNYGEKSFSSGTLTSRSRKGPPSTIDFIKRMKDKIQTPKQTLACNTCLSCPTSSRTNNRVIKTQSPSIIDTFRYRGGKQSKLPSCGRRKIQRSTGSSKENNVLPSLAPSWTPVDKRARQKLSFIKNGNEKQSKLVWRNMNVPTADCSLRKKYRDDT